jgi:hypothetical protein
VVFKGVRNKTRPRAALNTPVATIAGRRIQGA